MPRTTLLSLTAALVFVAAGCASSSSSSAEDPAPTQTTPALTDQQAARAFLAAARRFLNETGGTPEKGLAMEEEQEAACPSLLRMAGRSKRDRFRLADLPFDVGFLLAAQLRGDAYVSMSKD